MRRIASRQPAGTRLRAFAAGATRSRHPVCRAHPLHAETIERLVRERIAALANTPAGMQAVAERIPLRIASERQDLGRQKTSQESRIELLSGKLDQLDAAMDSADESSRALYDARIAELTSERGTLRGQLRAIEARLGVLENLVLKRRVVRQGQFFKSTGAA